MSTTLVQANRQWESRPADQRFASLQEMHQAAVSFKRSATAREIMSNALEVTAHHNDLILCAPSHGWVGKALNNYSYGQLCQRAKAPAGYLNTLPTRVAAECLNHGLRRIGDDNGKAVQILEGNSVRAITSDRYSRIWNADITARLLDLEARGPWQPGPAAFDGSRSLYLGERDMFAFLVDNERRIFERGPGGGLGRGFFVSNSEVGDAAFAVMTFYYEFVCGNHRVWGAQGISEAKIVHIGHDQSSRAFDMLAVEVRKYAEASTADDEAKVERCRIYEIGSSKEDVLNAIFGLRMPVITKKIANEAYDLAERRVDWYGSPRSAWGYAGGLTEIARDMPNASDRHQLDLAATRVMEMAD